jgi:hypothetical protein
VSNLVFFFLNKHSSKQLLSTTSIALLPILPNCSGNEHAIYAIYAVRLYWQEPQPTVTLTAVKRCTHWDLLRLWGNKSYIFDDSIPHTHSLPPA